MASDGSEARPGPVRGPHADASGPAAPGSPRPSPGGRPARPLRGLLASRLLPVLPVLLPALLVACDGRTGSASTDAFTDFLVEEWPYPSDVQAVQARNGMVSTTDEHATRVGLEVLQEGGNAVDAAVASSFALAVVNPEAGNIGGGGFMVLRLADDTRAALDYREKAPAAATRDMYLDDEGNLTDRSVVGHLAAGVPGTVMGLWEAHRRHGSLPWERLVQPAVDLAYGFEVHERFRRSLEASEERLRIYDATREIFLPGGEIPEVGETFEQLDLARTLERIRDQGPDGFYAGRTARLIVREMERGGGIITAEDLASYDVAWREPVVFDYRGHTVISMAPSSSGGVTLAEIANIVETVGLDTVAWHSAEMVHHVAEAMRRGFVDRNAYLSDPAFHDLPLERLASQEYAERRAATIEPDAASPSAGVEPGLGPASEVLGLGASAAPAGAAGDGEGNTTHLSVVDGAGNAVAVTTTINSWFGSRVTVEGAGFVLNNEMDDFAAKPGTPNQYGLVQGVANAVEPGKRPLSAMTPTIVLDPEGRLFMVTGTPGGATIITTVFQTISNVVDYGMSAGQAVNAPRIHHQHLPDQIFYEPDGLPDPVVARLEAMGHTLVERGGMSGDAQVIVVGPEGTLSGWSDPRRGGTVLGY